MEQQPAKIGIHERSCVQDSLLLATILSCIHLYVANKTQPEPRTAPIKYFNETAHASTPGAKVARRFDTYLTYCPEKINATLAPRPNNGSIGFEYYHI